MDAQVLTPTTQDNQGFVCLDQIHGNQPYIFAVTGDTITTTQAKPFTPKPYKRFALKGSNVPINVTCIDSLD